MAIRVDGASQMAHQEEPKEWKFPSASGGVVEVVCPICKNDHFFSIGPEELDLRKGFQHVIVGRTHEDKILALPVRSKICSNCGYVLRFLFPKNTGETNEG
jgi:hypothetical protein